MKTCKLIKEYPGSGELGSINNLNDYMLEKFSDFFELIEKDYEVIQVSYATEIRTLFDGEYRLTANGIGFDLEYILKNGGKAHSIKRMSDGEEFTIGDRILINNPSIFKEFFGVISNIYVSSSGELVIEHDHGTLSNKKGVGIFNIIKKLPLEYEIISYFLKDRPKVISFKKRGGVRHDEFWNLCSVKRISDGEVFTIGDKIDFNGEGIGTLLGIEFEIAPMDKGTGKLTFVNDNPRLGKWFSINELTKVKPPLLTTEDGVDIYLGGETWTLHKNTWGLSPKPTKHNNPNWFKSGEAAHWSFSTKEAAEKYLILNKPCLCLNDIIALENNNSIGALIINLIDLIKTRV